MKEVMATDDDDISNPPTTLVMKHRTKANMMRIITILVIVVLFGSIEYFRCSHSSTTPPPLQQAQVFTSETSSPMHSTSLHSLELEKYLQVEQIFSTTLKNCLGEYCLDQPFPNKANNDKEDLVRVGILFPDPFFPWNPLQHIFQEMISSIPKLPQQYEIIGTTHVPPYGYGRNHGWSKMIRFIDRIPLQTFRMLKQAQRNITDVDITSIQIKQIIRWQCRLNHVAAHSSMLSVFIDDLLDRPYFAFQQIFSYLNINVDRDILLSSLAKHFPSIQQYLLSTRTLTSPLTTLPNELLILSRTILQEELDTTKQLSKWPCKSFKELVSPSSSAPSPILDYAVLAANCSAPYVKCSVNFDFREQRNNQH